MHLLVPRAEASEKIERQIQEGEGLLQPRGNLQSATGQKQQWSDYTEELLSRIFSTGEAASEFNHSLHSGVSISLVRHSPGLDTRNFQNSLRGGIDKLRSIQRRLDLIPEAPNLVRTETTPRRISEGGTTVFLVHGRDERAKSTVARFLERLDLEVVILHEQPDKGRTVIEKFEQHATAGYAVVLMTPDDVGGNASSPTDLRARPRQNVVFELGYFVGTLGRSRVCALVADNVDMEMLSDYSGVLTVPLDAAGAWQLRLAREIKAAGLPVDLNRTV